MTPQPAGNPFPVSDNFKQTAPALTTAAVEALAFVSVPLMDETPVGLLSGFADHWAVRMTGYGNEDVSYAAVWELSALTHRLATDGEVPFTLFDISHDCGDDDCTADHTGQTVTINEFFTAAVAGDHHGAVKAYVRYVRQLPVEEWQRGRVLYLSMLLLHVATRVSQYRSDSVEEMPRLD